MYLKCYRIGVILFLRRRILISRLRIFVQILALKRSKLAREREKLERMKCHKKRRVSDISYFPDIFLRYVLLVQFCTLSIFYKCIKIASKTSLQIRNCHTLYHLTCSFKNSTNRTIAKFHLQNHATICNV